MSNHLLPESSFRRMSPAWILKRTKPLRPSPECIGEQWSGSGEEISSSTLLKGNFQEQGASFCSVSNPGFCSTVREDESSWIKSHNQIWLRSRRRTHRQPTPCFIESKQNNSTVKICETLESPVDCVACNIHALCENRTLVRNDEAIFRSIGEEHTIDLRYVDSVANYVRSAWAKWRRTLTHLKRQSK